ncbi:hypothetical protein GOM49_04590 [Clostridium bovifaecis]|uniref:Transposase InsH N-terminal domain-containing protein n=1 Tax=Clostridium bovifaecis TaxID=2184719 RepID=A0A6I6EZQ4_9CLOT|nr:hypothetical protein GOM49_04590 [Clostridium bovifaecis]
MINIFCQQPFYIYYKKDFSFVRDLVKDLYCADNGRPAVDPVVLFKMLFILLKITFKN